MGLKEGPRWIDFCFSGASGGWDKDADMTMQFLRKKDDAGITIIFFLSFFLTSPQIFFLPDAVATGPQLQLQILETGIIPKRETMFLSLLSGFLKA